MFRFFRPFLHCLDPERAHGLTLSALQMAQSAHLLASPPVSNPILGQKIWGLSFAAPLGMAAGFDKDGKVPHALFSLGFGFVEIGSVTPLAQFGNPKPRVFRVEKEGAIINALGFPSEGAERVKARLGGKYKGVLGVNLGANKDSKNFVEDYVAGAKIFAGLADFLVVNISSPNTEGLRDLQGEEALRGLIRGVKKHSKKTPLLVKLSPDMERQEGQKLAHVILEEEADGIIISNTTIARGGKGGLSGKPLFAPSTKLLRDVAAVTRGFIPLIGFFSLASAEDAYEKIRSGASLVELYTALVYQGPQLIGQIHEGLCALLTKDGFANISEAVGVDVKEQR
ncbi:MAG: quinone-dependent dihydroorotate dehydrogenase [Parvibaculales bacterium]